MVLPTQGTRVQSVMRDFHVVVQKHDLLLSKSFGGKQKA